MLKPTEHFAEVVRIRKPTAVRDLLEWSASLAQQSGGFVNTHFRCEMRGRKAGARAEEVAEMAAAHAVVSGNGVNGYRVR